jgi:hypothetical protein
MSWGIDQIYKVVFVKQSDGTRFHRDSSILLIDAIIHQSKLSCLFAMNDPVGCDQAIG